MHRVDADGYTTVSGKRRFIDRSLPTEEGTVDGAYWNNAIQEEIAQVIEDAGLTLRTSGSADQTANWGQLSQAIFSSNAISNAGLSDDLNLDRFSQGRLQFTDSGYTIDLNTQFLLVGDSDVSVRYHNKGINFYGASDPTGVLAYMRWAIYDVSGALTSATETDALTFTADAHSHKIGSTFTLAALYDTGIPDSTSIYAASLHNNYVGVRSLTPNCQLEFEDTAGNNYGLNKVTHYYTGSGVQLDLSEPIYLVVFYDANYLT